MNQEQMNKLRTASVSSRDTKLVTRLLKPCPHEQLHNTHSTPYYIIITENYNETVRFSRTNVVFKTITWEFPAKTLTYAMAHSAFTSCIYLPVTVENTLSFQFGNTFGPLQWVRSERSL